MIDLRWLNPLPIEAMLGAVRDCRQILVVDETRATGGVSEGRMTALHTAGMPATRLAAEDSFIATGPAYGATMPSKESILAAAQELLA